MPLETATYISDLNTANPVHADQVGQGDSHIRLIKSVLKNTFPNVNAAVTATDEQLNAAASPFPTGALMPFYGTTATAGAGAVGWLRCNGTTYTSTDYPALAAYLGGGATFVTPNFEDTGRFLRSVRSGVAVGTQEGNQNAAHTHSISFNSSGSGTTEGVSNGHTHSVSGDTGGQSNNHNHTVSNSFPSSWSTFGPSGGGSDYCGSAAPSQSPTSDNSANHTHFFAATTSDISADHNHDFSVTVSGSGTSGSSGAAEARPEAVSVIYYIHT